jgi:hypothetical protein
MAGHFGCVNDQAHVVKNTGDVGYHLGISSGSGDPQDFGSGPGYEAAGTAPGATDTGPCVERGAVGTEEQPQAGAVAGSDILCCA